MAFPGLCVRLAPPPAHFLPWEGTTSVVPQTHPKTTLPQFCLLLVRGSDIHACPERRRIRHKAAPEKNMPKSVIPPALSEVEGTGAARFFLPRRFVARRAAQRVLCAPCASPGWRDLLLSRTFPAASRFSFPLLAGHRSLVATALSPPLTTSHCSFLVTRHRPVATALSPAHP
jgi:hypothetical protein